MKWFFSFSCFFFVFVSIFCIFFWLCFLCRYVLIYIRVCVYYCVLFLWNCCSLIHSLWLYFFCFIPQSIVTNSVAILYFFFLLFSPILKSMTCICLGFIVINKNIVNSLFTCRITLAHRCFNSQLSCNHATYSSLCGM